MALVMETDSKIKAALEILQSDPDEAMVNAEETFRSAQAQGDKKLAAKAKCAMSSIHLQKWNSRAAVDAAEDALQAFKDLQDTAGQASALRAIVEARLSDGAPEPALRMVSDAMERFRAAGDGKAEAAMLLLQAEIRASQDMHEEAAAKAAQASELLQKVANKDAAVGHSLLKLSDFYVAAWKPSDAVRSAEAAGQVFQGLQGSEGKAGGGAAALRLATALAAEKKYDAAMAEVSKAMGVFEGLKDRHAQCEVLRTKVGVCLADKRPADARTAAADAVAMFKDAKDSRGEAAAHLLVAEVCVHTLQLPQAVQAATEALNLYKSLGLRAGQAAALAAICAADCDNEAGQAFSAASERAAVFKDMGASYQQADALLALGNLHLSQIGRKIARCNLASADDSIAALRAAKDAHALFAVAGSREGMESSMRLVSQVLLYNNVPAEVVEAAHNPEEIFQDVMSGKYSHAKNALPQKPNLSVNKIEEVVPSAKQLDKGKFAWNNPLAGYSYTLIWQPAKDRQVRGRKPRGEYDILTLSSGNRTTTVPTAIQAKSNPACGGKQDSLVIYMLATDCHLNYCASMMAAVQTMGAMITARLPRLTFVQFDESHFDWTDTKVRQCNLYPVILGLLRSARIEAPNVNIGYVGGDAASWIADPEPMIESFFDTIECDESELIYKRGDAFAPLLVHRPLDDPVTYCKPKKSAWGRGAAK